jgi:hypothetical protein
MRGARLIVEAADITGLEVLRQRSVNECFSLPVDDVVALRGQTNFPSFFNHIAPSGKSILVFRKRVKPRKQKYSASHFCKSEL